MNVIVNFHMRFANSAYISYLRAAAASKVLHGILVTPSVADDDNVARCHCCPEADESTLQGGSTQHRQHPASRSEESFVQRHFVFLNSIILPLLRLLSLGFFVSLWQKKEKNTDIARSYFCLFVCFDRRRSEIRQMTGPLSKR